MRASGLLLIGVLAALSACAPRVADLPSLPGPPPEAEPRIEPEPLAPGAGAQSLARWGQENHFDALMAYARSCGLVREPAYMRVCDEARALSRSADTSPSRARAFFEQRFMLEPVDGQGLLTGYFAPEYLASPVRTDTFDMPLLAAPAGLSSMPERSVIEAEALQGRGPWQPLAWLRAEDLFFLQIQGSGYLTLPDGRRLRAGYAADNGHPFSGIARVMVQQGILADHQTSADNIRRWLSDNRGERARAIMATNARYIFFSLAEDDAGHPAGAASVPLVPRRAIAVDPAHWRYGELMWVEADGATLAGAMNSYHGLATALDTGSAIRGRVRADLYLGRGEEAGREAGTIRHPLRFYRLVPRP